MQKEKSNRKNEGITLIALIITIIVMLILVGVSVTVALNGGLFSTAKQATSRTQLESDREKLLSIVMGAIGDEGKVILSELDEAIEATNGDFTGSNWVYRSKAGNKFRVLENGSVIDYDEETPPAETTGRWQINETTDKLEHVATDGTVTTTELTIGSLVAYNEGTSGSYVADATKGIGTSREVTFDANDMVQFNLIGGTFTTTGANGTVAAGDLSWKVFGINEDGQIELISTTPTGSKLWFKKSEQITTIDENTALNDFCNGIYGQGEYAQGARSLSLTDINNLTGVDFPKNSISYVYPSEAIRDTWIEAGGLQGGEIVGIDDSGLVDYMSDFWISTDSINTFLYHTIFDYRIASCLLEGAMDVTESVEVEGGSLPVYPIVILEPGVSFTDIDQDGTFEFAE